MARVRYFLLEMVANIAIRCWLLSGLLAVSPAALSQSNWERISTQQLDPGEQRIILLEQESVDLAVRLSSGNEILQEQDGPDRTLGTEVIFLKNDTASSRQFDISIRPLYRSPSPVFTLESIHSPGQRDAVLADVLSKAHQAWLADDTAEPALSLLEPLLPSTPASELDLLVLKSFTDALIRSGQSELAIRTLESRLRDIDSGSRTKLYLHWMYADALYQALYIREAGARINLIYDQSELTLTRNSAVDSADQWLFTQISITAAAIQIGAGRQVGDRNLIREGGELLHSALLNLSSSNDYALRARLIEYLSGFYSFYDGRDNPVTAQLLNEAELLYQRAGEPDHLVAIRNNQAHTALGRGEINTALRLYLEALDLQSNSKHIEGKAHVRARLGYLYFILGDYRRAEMRYLESIQLYESLGLDRRLIHNILELAEVLRADKRVDESLARLLEVQARISDNTGLEERLRLFTQLAHGYLDLGEVDDAERSFQQALTTLALDTSEGQARIQQASRLYHLLEHDILKSRLAIAQGRLDEAISIIDASLMQLSADQQEPLQQLKLLSLMMRIYFKIDRVEDALATGEKALSLIEAVRTTIDFQAQAPQWVARTNYVTSGMVAILLSQSQNGESSENLQRAYEILQRNRARSLRESRLHADNAEPEIQSSLQDSVNELRQALIAAVLRGESTTHIERELARSEEALALATNRVAEPGVISILPLSGLQQNLSDNEVAYIYASDELASHLIAIRHDSTQTHTLPAEKEVSELVADALVELGDSNSSLEQTRLLADMLLPDTQTKEGAHVLIETSGIFSRIPFPVLFNIANGGEHSISTMSVPSFTAYFDSHRNQRSSGGPRLSLAVFADPAFSLRASDESSNLARSNANNLGRLPFTRIEAENILATFESKDSAAYYDKNATIMNFLKPETRDARILHIAAHGFASTTDPLFLGLAFANEGIDESGLLTTQEISAYRFSNELVVISACETAQGKLLEGEGLMSMSRAFLANGANATLSTLWPVSDRANAAFMAAFYEALHTQKMSMANAVRSAQAKLQLNPRFRHPFYWGAFVLQMANSDTKPII